MKSINKKLTEELILKARELGLTGKQLDTYVSTNMYILEKERKNKAEEEAKLLGTAMQQLLPEIFEDKRAIPNRVFSPNPSKV